MAQLASSGAQISPWGPEWNFAWRDLDFGGSDKREKQSHDVTAASYHFVNAGQQQVVELKFPLEPGEPWIIELEQTGLTVATWKHSASSVVTSEPSQSKWCLNPPCTCLDGRNLFPDARSIPENDPTFTAGLTGSATGQATISARVLNVDEACNDLEPTFDLAGVWVAEPSAVVDAYTEAYAEIGIAVTGASGELSMTLFEDYTAHIFYDEVRLGLDSSLVKEVIISGSGVLNWQTVEGSLVFSGLSQLQLGVLTPSISSEPLVITEADLGVLNGTTTATYVREGSILTLSNIAGSLTELEDGSTGVLVFPAAWIRAGDAPAPQ